MAIKISERTKDSGTQINHWHTCINCNTKQLHAGQAQASGASLREVPRMKPPGGAAAPSMSAQAIEWDGCLDTKDTIVRKNGRITGPMFKELNQWANDTAEYSNKDAARKVFELINKYFGPYNPKVSEYLRQEQPLRKTIERLKEENIERAKSDPAFRFDRESELEVYYRNLAPAQAILDTTTIQPGWRSNDQISAREANRSIFRSYAASRLGEDLAPSLLQDLAEQTIAQAQADMNARIDQGWSEKLYDLQKLHAKLRKAYPSIPGENQDFNKATDLDNLNYGTLVCRHRAPLAWAMLKHIGVECGLAKGNGHVWVVMPEDKKIFDPSSEGFFLAWGSARYSPEEKEVTNWNGNSFKFEYVAGLSPLIDPNGSKAHREHTKELQQQAATDYAASLFNSPPLWKRALSWAAVMFSPPNAIAELAERLFARR